MKRPLNIIIVGLVLLGGLNQALLAGPALSKNAYNIIQAAEESLANNQPARAIKTLKALLDSSAERPYEQAIVLQMLAHAEISLDHPAAAVPLLKQSLALNSLPPGAQQDVRYNLAQLYMMSEDFDNAIQQIKTWIKQEKKASAKAHALLGSAYLQSKRYKSAIAPLKQAIALQQQPSENWYQALLSAYNQLRQYKHCAELLHRMIKLFPQRSTYWQQLAGIELLRQRYSEALAIMQLAYLRGYLNTETDLVNLAQLYLQQGAPYKAAQLLDREITAKRIQPSKKIYELMADAWYQARETAKSMAALKKALKHGKANAQLSLRLAHLYLEFAQPDKAERILTHLLANKISATDKSQAWLLLGIVRHKTNQAKAAKQAFSQAAKLEVTRNDAQQWLAYLEALQ